MKSLLFVLAISLSAIPVFAWHTNTHLQMTRDAVMFMPADFQKFFKANLKIMEPGVRDPDEVLGDFQNHYYLADTREGGAIDRIDSIISTLNTKLETKKDYEAVRQFCYLAHYIGDLWTPESLIRKINGRIRILYLTLRLLSCLKVISTRSKITRCTFKNVLRIGGH